MIGQCMLAKMATKIPANPHLERTQNKTPTSGNLFPYLPKYAQYEDIPELDPESVKIPTFIR